MPTPLCDEYIGQRIGTFNIPRKLIETQPQAVVDFFKAHGLLVLKAEMEFHTDGVAYLALGETLEPVPFGRIPYHYMLQQKCNEEGHIIELSLSRLN